MRIITRGLGKLEDTQDDQMLIVQGFGGRFTSVARTILYDTALFTNLKRSLDKYCYDNLYTTEGLDVSYWALPFDDSGVTEWVQPRIMETSRNFARQTSGTSYGHEVNALFKINVFVKKSGVTLAHKHYLLRDKVAQYFKIGEDIDLNDYMDDDSTLANIRVRSMVDDAPLPETNTLLGYEVSWNVTYTEEITDVDSDEN